MRPRFAVVVLGAGEITLPRAQVQRQAVLDQRAGLQANEQQIAERIVALQLLTGRGIFAGRAIADRTYLH